MFRTGDICSITDFVRNASEHAKRLRTTGRPQVLTVNGSAELVVQNSEAYQSLVDRLDELETLIALEEAATEMERGEGTPADEALRRLKHRLGVRAEALRDWPRGAEEDGRGDGSHPLTS